MNEFYSSYDPYLGDAELNSFDDLDEILPLGTTLQNDRVEVEVEIEVRVETETEVRVETETDGSRSKKDETEADGSENDDNDDSEYIVDLDNDVEEADVDMENFRLNVDLEAEFIGCDSDNSVQDLDVDIDDVFDNEEFISGSKNEDEFDWARRRQLKQLRKQAKSNSEGRIFKTYFYVGKQFGSAAEVKKLIKRHSIETRREIKIIKNDKERVRAAYFGKLPSFETSGPSAGQKEQVGPIVGQNEIVRPSVGPNVAVGPSKPSGSTNQPIKDKWSRNKINVIKEGKPSCRKVDKNNCP